MSEQFLYRHCAKCGRRIPPGEIRCSEHRIKEFGKADVIKAKLSDLI